MRIGFFTDSYFPWVNGVSVSVRAFAEELEKLGHEVFIFCPGSSRGNESEHAHIIRFRSFPSIWHEEFRDTIPFSSKNIEQAKSYNLDIIHVHTPAQMGLFGARIARETGVPLVTTYHTDIEQYAEVYRRILMGFIAGAAFGPMVMGDIRLLKDTLKTITPERPIRNWNKKVVREGLNVFHGNCDLVLAPSVKIQKLLKSYKTPTTVRVLATGVDPGEAKHASKASIRKRFGIADDAILLMITARLGQEKNIQTLIAALAKIVMLEPRVHLLIAGTGPHHDLFVDQANELNVAQHITFAGLLSRPDVYAALRDADIFTFPSVMDTQGLVINEAALMGLPIVYVDEDISPITINKKTGLRARNTIKSLADTIMVMVKKPALRKQYGQAAHEAAMNLTMSKQAKLLEHEYQLLLDSQK
ncbi:glycosyltransferase [bacterium]|nr:glycosyltransferase [bacterium]